MTSRDMARSHRRRAARVMREAERLFAEEDWSLCVRRCQEAVELALKALLRAAGAEVPKVHDVSGGLSSVSWRHRRFHRLQPTVDVAPVPQADHHDGQHVVADLVHDPIDPSGRYAEQLRRAGQLLAARWPWIVSERVDDCRELGAGGCVQALQRARRLA